MFKVDKIFRSDMGTKPDLRQIGVSCFDFWRKKMHLPRSYRLLEEMTRI
jgi:hypothetical protein